LSHEDRHVIIPTMVALHVMVWFAHCCMVI
jgi:hypothetical protein